MKIAEEKVEKDEEVYISKIAIRFKQELSKYYKSGSFKRMFHPKMHGLVKAEFIVEDNIADKYKIGIFKNPISYPTWIRFSNAKRHPSADKKKDMRGMALKLIGVNGKKLIEQDKNAVTQDFLLVTSKTLQTKSVKDFKKSIYALTDGGLKLFFFAITHLGIIIRSIKQISRCSNLLEESYFSTTPSLFGKENAVKYAVIPQSKSVSPFPSTPSNSFLKERLINDLDLKDIYFDFMVQFQTDSIKMPIEDPTKEWKSPFVKLATIKIPQQKFDFISQTKYGENLSFNPWHSIAEHRPLGGANRARKKVYEIVSNFRHKNNDVKQTEPTELENFNIHH